MNACVERELSFREAPKLQRIAKALDCVINHGSHKSISEYALQADKHTAMCSRRFIPRRMERTADDRREILRLAIKEHGLKIAPWAKRSGVDKNSIYNFLNGHSQSLDLMTYAKLARSAELPIWKLTGDQPEPTSPTSIWVAGNVEAGVFKDAIEWDRSLWFEIDVPVPSRFRSVAKALQIRGNSMSIDYPDGSIAIWVDTLDFRPARHEDDVVVYKKRHDGCIEATLKQLRVDDQGKRWLWPQSHDPLHQTPLDVASPGEDVEDIVIKGIVIGSYRPKHY